MNAGNSLAIMSNHRFKTYDNFDSDPRNCISEWGSNGGGWYPSSNDECSHINLCGKYLTHDDEWMWTGTGHVGLPWYDPVNEEQKFAQSIKMMIRAP